MKYVVTINGKRYEADVASAGFAPAARPAFAAAPVAAPAAPVAAPVAPAAPAPAPAPAAAPAAAGAGDVTAPMPGNVLDVLVNVGDTVSAGQTVVILEAMKMENEIVAEVAGTVKAVSCKKGDVVDTGAVLVSVG